MTNWRADSVVDELVPDQVDWQHWVRRYPFAALSVAAICGYLLGRGRGEELVDSVTRQAADSFSQSVHQLIDSGL